MQHSVATTCPYCGVGCGVVVDVAAAPQPEVRGDKNHPANFGRLCSKGAALGETLDLAGRLLRPKRRGEDIEWGEALDHIAGEFGRIIARHGPDAVAFYVSGQLLTEDYYVVNKLMKGFIGSANIDTNSRLCMASSVAGHKRAFGCDAVPCSYEDLELADLVVLVGSNTAWCHPVLFQRLRQARKKGTRIVVIDPRRTATCDEADLHLAVQPGTDAVLFNGLLAYLADHGMTNLPYVDHCTEGVTAALAAARASATDIAVTAKECGLSVEEVADFFERYARTERVVTVYSQGINQSSSGTDKVNTIINCHLLTGRIGRPGMGPFSFTGQPNAMGGREVGGLANQLAAHMELDNAEHQSCVQRFWNAPAVANRPGLKAVDLFDAIEDGRVKAVWIMATNPVVSLPDADRVRAALAQCELVVVSDCVSNTDTTALAHVLLPALAWGEKDGTVTNSERRISRQRPFLNAPGEAKADWWMVCEVAKRMGYTEQFTYAKPHEIFCEHAALSGFENNGRRDFDISALRGLTEADYDRLVPMQWPVTAQRPAGTPRMFVDGLFFTSSRRARLVPVNPRRPVVQTDAEFPFTLNSGRVRDHWHTMTRTAKTARLSEHTPEPYLEIHPRDATRVQLVDSGLAEVTSRHGRAIVRVNVSDTQQMGSVFIPMHWSSQFSGLARVNALTGAHRDPISGQPEFKQTPVHLAPYRPAWHGFMLSRRRINLRDASYWTQATGSGFIRYELAGEQSPKDWPAWARSMLCAQENDVNWVEYLDVGARRYRGVRLVENRVESCLFIAPSHELPSRGWLAGLFTKDTLSPRERTHLVTGKAPQDQADGGRIVCACFGVGLNTLTDAIRKQHLTTPEAVGLALKAGTNCGSCVPELRATIAHALANPLA